MGSFSTNLSNVATTLLTNYGEVVTGSREIVSSFIPSTGEIAPGAPVSYSGYGHPSIFSNQEIDNVVILQGDIKLLFQCSTTAPLVDDIITVNSVDYTIKQVRSLRAQGSDIIYVLVLRQ